MKSTPRTAKSNSPIGSLVTLLVVGAGAVYWWRQRKLKRCVECRQEVRAEAQVCKYCGAVLKEEGPTIDVEPGKL